MRSWESAERVFDNFGERAAVRFFFPLVCESHRRCSFASLSRSTVAETAGHLGWAAPTSYAVYQVGCPGAMGNELQDARQELQVLLARSLPDGHGDDDNSQVVTDRLAEVVHSVMALVERLAVESARAKLKQQENVWKLKVATARTANAARVKQQAAEMEARFVGRVDELVKAKISTEVAALSEAQAAGAAQEAELKTLRKRNDFLEAALKQRTSEAHEATSTTNRLRDELTESDQARAELAAALEAATEEAAASARRLAELAEEREFYRQSTEFHLVQREQRHSTESTVGRASCSPQEWEAVSGQATALAAELANVTAQRDALADEASRTAVEVRQHSDTYSTGRAERPLSRAHGSKAL